MNKIQIESKARESTGITAITACEMPIDASIVTPPHRCILINIGPIEVDISNASKGLERCISIVNLVLEALVHEPSLLNCRLGISLFVAPGGQAFRALAGSYDVTTNSERPYRMVNVYSNIKSFREVLAVKN